MRVERKIPIPERKTTAVSGSCRAGGLVGVVAHPGEDRRRLGQDEDEPQPPVPLGLGRRALRFRCHAVSCAARGRDLARPSGLPQRSNAVEVRSGCPPMQCCRSNAVLPARTPTGIHADRARGAQGRNDDGMEHGVHQDDRLPERSSDGRACRATVARRRRDPHRARRVHGAAGAQAPSSASSALRRSRIGTRRCAGFGGSIDPARLGWPVRATEPLGAGLQAARRTRGRRGATHPFPIRSGRAGLPARRAAVGVDDAASPCWTTSRTVPTSSHRSTLPRTSGAAAVIVTRYARPRASA